MVIIIGEEWLVVFTFCPETFAFDMEHSTSGGNGMQKETRNRHQVDSLAVLFWNNNVPWEDRTRT